MRNAGQRKNIGGREYVLRAMALKPKADKAPGVVNSPDKVRYTGRVLNRLHFQALTGANGISEQGIPYLSISTPLWLRVESGSRASFPGRGSFCRKRQMTLNFPNDFELPK